MMGKLITIITIVIVIFLGYLFIKSHEEAPQNTQEATAATESYMHNFLADLRDMISGVAPFESIYTPNPPVVSQADLGELSPLYGMVKIQRNQFGPAVTNPKHEYIVLKAQGSNTEPVVITDWSLQSMITGVRVYIPDAVEDVVMHTINPTYKIDLRPGQEAVVSTGASPIGISFKTNMCTGYFAEFQSFDPSLAKRCPLPSEAVPSTIENIQQYGAPCMELLSYLQPCQYVSNDVASEFGIDGVSEQCIEHLRTELTYTTCRAQNIGHDNYQQNEEWRVFLASDDALWSKGYEVIRLLDEQGRTVDVYSY